MLQIRRLGTALEIDALPTLDTIEKATFEPLFYLSRPSQLDVFRGNVNIQDLLTHLRNAPQGIVPNTLVEPASEHGYIARHTSATVYHRLTNYFNELTTGERENSLSPTRKSSLNILKHYTHQINEQLKAANTTEKREIYIELKQRIFEQTGCAMFHCEDAKKEVASVIMQEKLLGSSLEGTDDLVKDWIIRKRNAMVDHMLNELIRNNRGSFVDVSSGVAYWKYLLKDELSLGAINRNTYDFPCGLTKEKIIKEFHRLYTPKKVIEWVLNEVHQENEKNKNKAFKWNSINDFLSSRIRNYHEIQGDLLDDDWKLRKEAVALYLEECGVLNLTLEE